MLKRLQQLMMSLPQETQLNVKDVAYKVLFLNSCLIFITWVHYERLTGWLILMLSYIFSCFLFPVFVIFKYPRELAFWLYGYICLSEIPSVIAKCGFQNKYDWIFFIPRMPVAIMLFCIVLLEITNTRRMADEWSLSLINKIIVKLKHE